MDIKNDYLKDNFLTFTFEHNFGHVAAAAGA